jgi:hypothetical protein
MNRAEADAIAHEWLSRLRLEPYATLAGQIGHAPVTEAVTRGDVVYQVQVVYHWDSQPSGNVRVIVAVDDGAMRAFVPVTSDFVKSPDGHFVGE